MCFALPIPLILLCTCDYKSQRPNKRGAFVGKGKLSVNGRKSNNKSVWIISVPRPVPMIGPLHMPGPVHVYSSGVR